MQYWHLVLGGLVIQFYLLQNPFFLHTELPEKNSNISVIFELQITFTGIRKYFELKKYVYICLTWHKFLVAKNLIQYLLIIKLSLFSLLISQNIRKWKFYQVTRWGASRCQQVQSRYFSISTTCEYKKQIQSQQFGFECPHRLWVY